MSNNSCDVGAVINERRRHHVTDAETLDTFCVVALPVVFGVVSRLNGGNREAAEDVVQQAFGDLVAAVKSGRVDEVDVGWVVVAARRRLIDQIRRSTTDTRVFPVAGEHAPVVHEPDWDSLQADAVLSLLSCLTPDQRVAVVLHYVDGLLVADIATELGRTVHSVESLLARARRTMRTTAIRGSHDD